MDEKTKEALSEALKMFVDSLQSGKEFVVEQAPLVVQEMVTLGRIQAALSLAAIFSATALLLYLLNKRYGSGQLDKRMASVGDINSAEPVPMVIGGIAALTCTAILCVNITWMLEAWFAPRLYIIHQLKDLL